RRLEIAEQKVLAVRKYTLQLQKEAMMYKGQVQRFATAVSQGLPQAAHELEAIIIKLEEYAAGGFGGAPTEVTSQAEGSMRRAVEERPEAQPEASKQEAPEPPQDSDAPEQRPSD